MATRSRCGKLVDASGFAKWMSPPELTGSERSPGLSCQTPSCTQRVRSKKGNKARTEQGTWPNACVWLVCHHVHFEDEPCEHYLSQKFQVSILHSDLEVTTTKTGSEVAHQSGPAPQDHKSWPCPAGPNIFLLAEETRLSEGPSHKRTWLFGSVQLGVSFPCMPVLCSVWSTISSLPL